jgi:Tol biopolymer transport system component
MPTLGTGRPEELVEYPIHLYEVMPSPDGRYVAVRTGTGPGSLRRDILGLRLGTDSVFPVIETTDNEKALSFSPDGRFVVYQSDVLGWEEVYVSSFPDLGVAESVSTNGGSMPLWSPAGDEIFYVDFQGNMTVARVETDPEFRVIHRETLFQLPEEILTDEWYTLCEFVPEDDRFLMIQVLDPEPSQIHLVKKED